MQKISRLNGWITDPAPSVSQLQRHWLTRPGALTQGLRALGVLTLRVLSENVCRAGQDEAIRLALPTGHALWQREVCMSILGVDCVVARSVTPLKASNGHWQAVRQLRNRPLADILYHDRAIARSAFEFTTVRLGMPLYRLTPLSFATPLQPLSPLAFGVPPQPITEAAPNSPARVCARRSVFVRAHQPLLVAEAFLPAFWNIAQGATSKH
ncbi:MAG: chorismate--pyruvate lyase family protein [Zwartia sp.]